LKTHPNDKPERKRLRHRAQPDAQNEGLPEPQNGFIYGLQTDDVSQEKWRKLSGTNRLSEVIQGVDLK
jgi:hypothetical protein